MNRLKQSGSAISLHCCPMALVGKSHNLCPGMSCILFSRLSGCPFVLPYLFFQVHGIFVHPQLTLIRSWGVYKVCTRLAFFVMTGSAYKVADVSSLTHQLSHFFQYANPSKVLFSDLHHHLCSVYFYDEEVMELSNSRKIRILLCH